MITFIVGATGYGKSSLARELSAKQQAPVISAGAWIRKQTGITGHGPEAAQQLAESALTQLAQDPLTAVKYLAAQMNPSQDNIIEGCRNPTDILHFAKAGDHVIDVGGTGVPGSWEAEGLTAIRACQPHLERLGVSWTTYTRHFAKLPFPLKAFVESKYLRGKDGPLEAGTITALESYEDKPPTACWRSVHGGVFHDLPLEAFVVGDHSPREPLEGGHAYGNSGPGIPVVESSPVTGELSFFGRDRKLIGRGGTVLWAMHWPAGNELFYFLDFQGRVFLWPPHKLLWDSTEMELPDWKKLR